MLTPHVDELMLSVPPQPTRLDYIRSEDALVAYKARKRLLTRFGLVSTWLLGRIRVAARRLILLVVICVRKAPLLLLLVASLHCLNTLSRGSKPARRPQVDTCPVHAHDGGRWVRKENVSTHIDNLEDYFAAAGFTGCAGSSENGWQFFGDGSPDFEREVERTAYTWQPHPNCRLHESDPVEQLQQLIDYGGLLIVGDSLQRQFFFELSCELHGHVRWQAEAIEGVEDAETGRRFGATQHLLLDPNATANARLRIPSSFNFELPLITYYASYLPLSRREMMQLPDVPHHTLRDGLADVKWAVLYEKASNETLDYFIDARHRYRTMIYNTGTHFMDWTVFPGANPDQLLIFLRRSVETWFRTLRQNIRQDQRVLIRATNPGHDDAVNAHHPVHEVPHTGNRWNWRHLPDYNDIIRDEAMLLRDRRFQWIGGERLARLRPDAHLKYGDDGLHLSVGTGVYRALCRYMWHHVHLSLV